MTCDNRVAKDFLLWFLILNENSPQKPKCHCCGFINSTQRVSGQFRLFLLIFLSILSFVLLRMARLISQQTVHGGGSAPMGGSALSTAMTGGFTATVGVTGPHFGVLPSVMSLKSLLQLPLRASGERRLGKEPAVTGCVIKEEEKKLEDESLGFGAVQSAFLGPLLWDKTLSYDGIECVDLDEFLTEHGLPPSPVRREPQFMSTPVSHPSLSPTHSVMDLSRPASRASSSSFCSSTSSTSQSIIGGKCLHSSDTSGLSSPDSQSTSSPKDSEKDEVLVNFDDSLSDLPLSTTTSREIFESHKHRFTEEELKPRPVIKKARKMQVPDDLKDEKYWNRRHKNNEAAKRSRDARRLKENQITIRAAFLEKENASLRQEVAEMLQELRRCRSILSKYEAQHGPL
ncbi:hepatic leukemia factor-like [Protopterus annectens]|uniref:hepatic leukemia factor-like n=1 Tax=Protopterus annectens TaxID=7888 RepID=UPI001CFA8ED2|nr:hepatic leukemia factor-like [Protopterus annectens]